MIIMIENGEDNQKWSFEDDQTINSELGLVLDVQLSLEENGSPVIAYNKHNGDNQKFRILPVAEWVPNIGNAVKGKINP